MKSNKILQVITALFLIFAANANSAEILSKDEALNFAATKGEELLMAFQEPDLNLRFQKLDELFVTYIDVDYVSRFVMGKYWRQMSEEQKQAYQKLFLRYGLAYYKTLPLDYAQNVEYEIKNAEIDGNFTNVITNVKVNLGEEKQVITLVFRLHKVDGKIKAVDVKVAESSLLLAYRGKFYEMIAQDDGEIDWFLEDLGDITASMELNLREKAVNQQKSLEIQN